MLRGGGGPDNLLQYSCLENSMDRGAWQATVHRIAQSRTRLKQLSMQVVGKCLFWLQRSRDHRIQSSWRSARPTSSAAHTWELSVLTWVAFISCFVQKLATYQKATNMSSFSVGERCRHSGQTGLFCAWDSQNYSKLGTAGFPALNASSLHKSLWQSEMSPHTSRCLWLFVI